jgi:hypothetical protein
MPDAQIQLRPAKGKRPPGSYWRDAARRKTEETEWRRVKEFGIIPGRVIEVEDLYRGTHINRITLSAGLRTEARG